MGRDVAGAEGQHLQVLTADHRPRPRLKTIMVVTMEFPPPVQISLKNPSALQLLLLLGKSMGKLEDGRRHHAHRRWLKHVEWFHLFKGGG